MSEKVAIQLETLTRLANGFRESRGILDNLTTEQMIALAQEPVKPEQEKTVEITENGTTEITADEGYTLSKVTATVNVSASGGNYSIADRLAGIGPATITEADCEGITEIKENAFSLCSGMTTVELPSNITNIGKSAFANCKDIETVKYKVNAFSGISQYIFNACTGLKTVIFDASVRYIPGRMCEGCTNLENIVFPEGMLALENYNSGDYVFKGCKGLKTLNLPSTARFIENNMFEGCTGLTDLTFPASMASVGSKAFLGCTGLASVTFQERESGSSLALGDGAFQNCTSLVSVVLTNRVESIESLVFYGCSSLTNIIIPESVQTIGQSAFYLCTSLTNLTIPASVRTIYGYALHIGDTTNKATIRFMSATPPELIYSTAFDTTKLEKIIVPNGCGEAYRTATNWATVADFIEEAAE